MPDIDLSDREDDFDFSALLREKGVPAEKPTDAEADDEVEPDEETDDAAEEEEDVDPEEETEDEEDEPEDEDVANDDPVAAVLERFGIDPQGATEEQRKLAESHARLDKLRGRQGSELGDLRQQIEELRGTVESATRKPASPSPQITPDVVQALDEAAAEGGQAAVEAAMWALQNDPTQNGALYRRVMSQWAEVPGEAYNVIEFRQALSDFQADRAQSQRLAPIQEKMQNEQETATFESSWERVAAARSDMGEVAPTMLSLLEQNQKFRERVVEAIEAGDGEALDIEIEGLYLRAKEMGGHSSADTRAAKKRANVVRGNRSAGREVSKTSGQKLKDKMLADKPTSISAGLSRE